MILTTNKTEGAPVGACPLGILELKKERKQYGKRKTIKHKAGTGVVPDL